MCSDLVPQPSTPAVFRLSLWRQGTHVGWLGENCAEWAVVVPDIRRALLLEPCPYNGSVYYQVSNSLRYLTVSPDACIGFYNWANASGFTREGRHLVADDTGQKLALQSAERNDLCAWNGCRVLEVGFEPVGAAVGDQKRVGTPASALRDGSSLLVVGRPIRDAADPVAAARAILNEMSEALAPTS
jgi:hypothetical protein